LITSSRGPVLKSSHIFISGGHIRQGPDMAGFDHILNRCTSLSVCTRIQFFLTNSEICTSLGHHGYVDHVMVHFW